MHKKPFQNLEGMKGASHPNTWHAGLLALLSLALRIWGQVLWTLFKGQIISLLGRGWRRAQQKEQGRGSVRCSRQVHCSSAGNVGLGLCLLLLLEVVGGFCIRHPEALSRAPWLPKAWPSFSLGSEHRFLPCSLNLSEKRRVFIARQKWCHLKARCKPCTGLPLDICKVKNTIFSGWLQLFWMTFEGLKC